MEENVIKVEELTEKKVRYDVTFLSTVCEDKIPGVIVIDEARCAHIFKKNIIITQIADGFKVGLKVAARVGTAENRTLTFAESPVICELPGDAKINDVINAVEHLAEEIIDGIKSGKREE
ncbi:MAG: hypothetical protein IJ459_01930 [Clostridia bacterium]|nr:hypothetical protein [Clostridia bacterium]